MPRRPPASRPRGFTLVEILVVLLVFGIFAGLAYGGLTRVLEGEKRLTDAAARTARWQRTFLRLRDDFQQAVPRGGRQGRLGAPFPALETGLYDPWLALTREGYANPLGQRRPTLERIIYTWRDGKLYRRGGRAPDPAEEVDPLLTKADARDSATSLPPGTPRPSPPLELLDGLENVQWRYLNANNEWQDRWPSDAVRNQIQASNSSSGGNGNPPDTLALDTLPVAVEVTLTDKAMGKIRWVFPTGSDVKVLTQIRQGLSVAGALPASNTANKVP